MHLLLGLGLLGCPSDEPPSTTPDELPPPPLGHGVEPGEPPLGDAPVGAPVAGLHPRQGELQALLEAGRRGDAASFEAAHGLVDELYQASPDDARVLTMKGRVLVEQAHSAIDAMTAGSTFAPDAERWFVAAIAKDSGHAEAWRMLASWYELNGRHEDAIRCDQELLKRNPLDYATRAHLGTSLAAVGRYDEAEEMLRAAKADWEQQQASMPGFDQDIQLLSLLGIYQQLGLVLMRLGRDDEAEAVLLEAVERVEAAGDLQGPREIVACPFVALGALYKKTGQDGDSAAMLRRAADLEPYKASLQLDAALTSHLAGDTDEALEYVGRAAQISPTAQVLQLKRELETGELSASTLLDGAVRAFERYDFGAAAALVDETLGRDELGEAHVLRAFLLTLETDYAGATAALALAEAQRGTQGVDVVRGHLALGRHAYDEALAAFEASGAGADSDFQRVEGYDPTGFAWLLARMTWTGQAWALANQAKHAEALPSFEKVLAAKPADVFALLGKANAHNALGDFEAAQELLERLLAADPDNQYALAELALVKLNRGDEDAAEATFQQALAVEAETYTCPYEGLGLVYLRQGKVEDAKQSFEKAIEINPDIEYKKFNELARIYLAEGRYEEAEALLSKSIENHPFDDEARELLARVKAERR